MNCPLDGETLALSERRGVEIDYCPKCRGIWLDRGELDKLMAAADRFEAEDDDDRRKPEHREPEHREPEHREPEHREPEPRDHYESKPKKKRSFLSEMLEGFGE